MSINWYECVQVCARLEQHLINGYGLLTSDEGAMILAAINSKTQEGKAEQSSKTLVPTNSHITPHTLLSILIFIQPECYAAEP